MNRHINVQAEGMRVAEFLRLAWHPDQARYHETARRNLRRLYPSQRHHPAGLFCSGPGAAGRRSPKRK